mmetsp:Transcript_49053/g.136041  ORF Transcript_49053/g.136041 Transcript_49053/m.136041 type:complete len:234 (-) Transcript_49053:141-842(-)
MAPAHHIVLPLHLAVGDVILQRVLLLALPQQPHQILLERPVARCLLDHVKQLFLREEARVVDVVAAEEEGSALRDAALEQRQHQVDNLRVRELAILVILDRHQIRPQHRPDKRLLTFPQVKEEPAERAALLLVHPRRVHVGVEHLLLVRLRRRTARRRPLSRQLAPPFDPRTAILIARARLHVALAQLVLLVVGERRHRLAQHQVFEEVPRLQRRGRARAVLLARLPSRAHPL